MSDFYPEISLEVQESIVLLAELQGQDPEYLLRSPYSDDFLEIFTVKNQVLTVDTTDMTKWEKLEHESNELFDALTAAGKDLKDKDNAERMAYFRTSTQLLERIVGIQERALNLKKLAEFQQLVLSIMDDVLDGDQRAQVRDRLREAAHAD